MSYKYRLLKNGREQESRRYTWNELRDMGTFMLRDICVREKIMTKSAGIDPKQLNRSELMALLFRYRGREEDYLAEDLTEESAEILKDLTERVSLAAEKLEVPYKIELKKDVPLTEAEDVFIRHGFAGDYFVGTISDEQGSVLAVFEVWGERMSLLPGRVSRTLCAGILQDLTVLLFDASSSQKVIRAYNSQKCDPVRARGMTAAMARLPILSVTEAADAAEPLVIDFGAGYTVAASAPEGVYEVLRVRFQGGRCLCPSAAAVQRCGDGQAELRFGYEALRLIRRDGYGCGMTFYHNLKLFLYEERQLAVCDCDGNAAQISSDVLLRGFFSYIITLAKAQHGRNYKKLCFLTPEKRGRLALQRLREILPEYQIESARSESVNRVYREIIQRADYEGEASVTELVFHCGAGASSLVACAHETENTGVAYKVRLREKYLNGDGGFGGNRLTCLIFMYLKIRVMLAVTGRDEDIFGERFQDPYSCVDEHGGTEEVYERFRLLYEEAEQTVPTRFAPLEAAGLQRRQNFYRLWFLAENLKTAFFSGDPVNTIKLPGQFAELCMVNVNAAGSGDTEYRLTFAVHKDALELVMAPEIYKIVKRFIEPLCNEYGILMGYRIRFSGMSCQLPLFRDALREFTVGRRARLQKGSTEALKTKALEGAILCSRMEKAGRVIPEMTEEAEEISYIVTVESHEKTPIRIVSDNRPGCTVFGYVRRHIATRQVEFTICDRLGNEIGRRTVDLDIHTFRQTSYEELFTAYAVFREFQGDFDSIGEEEIRLFVYREENWDFCVLPAARRQSMLGVGTVSRFLFDDDGVDYFCGLF